MGIHKMKSNSLLFYLYDYRELLTLVLTSEYPKISIYMFDYSVLNCKTNSKNHYMQKKFENT